MIGALVDTGCTTTIADPRIVSTMTKNNEHIIAADGSKVMCNVGRLRLSTSTAGHDVNTQCLVLSSMLEQFKFVIGMGIIQQLGGVTITKTGHAEFKQFSIKKKHRFTRGTRDNLFLWRSLFPIQNVPLVRQHDAHHFSLWTDGRTDSYNSSGADTACAPF